LEDKGEVCFEEKVERLWRSGNSAEEIAQMMGVDQAWVESLTSMMPANEDSSAAQYETESG